jgi:hypothetical protein
VDFGSRLIPPPPCFAKKRLESVEKKGLEAKNSNKRGWILLKTLRASLQRRSRDCISEVSGVAGNAGGGQDSGGTELREEWNDGVAATIMEHFTSLIA